MPRSLAYGLGIILVGLALGFIAPPERVEHSWEKIPIFEAAFCFLGCLLILFAAKALGHLFLKRKEDYYDD